MESLGRSPGYDRRCLASDKLRVRYMKRPHEELPDLSVDDATDLLKVHSGTCEDPNDQRMYSGFLFFVALVERQIEPGQLSRGDGMHQGTWTYVVFGHDTNSSS